MSQIKKMIKKGYAKDAKELLTFLAIDSGAVKKTLEDIWAEDDICHYDLEKEMYGFKQSLKIGRD
ncbi:MAG TPA: hypothetical protein GX707_06240 [Epulopiscium sp.]|nr:hypothetical protein [Candidatus Epulonipiscium sp.]